MGCHRLGLGAFCRDDLLPVAHHRVAFHMNAATFTLEDAEALKAITARIPGWSGPTHYLFFKSLLAAHPQLKRLLMLGVYHGRDIAFILDILARYHPGREVEIVGVDKFNAEPCEDWPWDKRGMTWGQAFQCPPPDIEAAIRNTKSRCVALIKAHDADFLASSQFAFDAAYLDTAHDEPTVLRQLRQIARVMTPDGILCGDDYSDAGTWGVKRAVSHALSSHEVFGGWIWHAPVANLLKPA
jgi:hypothetical protein